MNFCHKLIYCLIIDDYADIVGVPVENDLKKSDTDGNQMYKASQ